MKTPEPDSFAKVVRWLIVVFFVYAAWHSYAERSAAPETPAPLPAQDSDIKKDSDCANKSARFPLFNINLLPLYVPKVSAQDIKTGNGEPAACGQSARFSYEYLLDKKRLEKGEKTIVIGSGEVMHGVELGLIGMKTGGVRELSIPPQLVSAKNTAVTLPALAKGQILTAKLSLGDLSPALPVSPFALRAVDERLGHGESAECGDSVNATLSLWKLDGTPLSSTSDKPISFIIGKGNLPYGIEQGVIGMTEDSARLIVLPPAYAQKLIKQDGTAPELLPALPADETVMVEVDNFHIENPTATTAPLGTITGTPPVTKQ